MKNALYTGSLLLGLCLFCWAMLSPFALSSMQNDVAMNQIKTGESAVMERSFLNLDPSLIKNVSLILGAGFIIFPVYQWKKKTS